MLVANSINGAVVSYAGFNGERQYWLFSLMTVAFTAYGGGVFAPIFIGRPSLPFGNDLVPLSILCAWYAVYNTRLQGLLVSLPVRAVWTALLGLFRLYSVTNMVTLAMNTLPTSPYYPIPLFGPIFCGTMVGCMGMFLPLSKGLMPIQKLTPWNIQAAFYSAWFFHTMVNDTAGYLGNGMRLIFGNHSRESVMVIIGLLQVIHLELQLFISPDMNLFAPVHKVFYLIFQVQGPIQPPGPAVAVVPASKQAGWAPLARRRLEIFLALLRPLVLLACFCLHVGLLVLPATLHAFDARLGPQHLLYRAMRFTTHLNGKWAHLQEEYVHGKEYEMEITRFEFEDLAKQSLPLGQGIGRCQYLNPFRRPGQEPNGWRQCIPYVAVLEGYECEYDPNPLQQQADALQGRCAAVPVLPPPPAPEPPQTIASSVLSIFDWTKTPMVGASPLDEYEDLPEDKPQEVLRYTELALVVYKDLVVNKFDLPIAVSHLQPQKVYPLLQTKDSLFAPGKPVYLLLLNDGKIVLWAQNPSANMTMATNRMVEYVYGTTESFHHHVISQGEHAHGISLDQDNGELVLLTDSVGYAPEASIFSAVSGGSLADVGKEL